MSHSTSRSSPHEKSRLRNEIESLLARLRSKNGAERQIARQRLVSIGGSAAPALVRCLSDPRKQVRWEAAKALRGIADPIAAMALVNTLEDRDSGVRWLAAVALIALGRDALPPLFRALLMRPDSDHLRRGVRHVCRDLAQTDVGDIAKPVLQAFRHPEPESAVLLAAYAALNRLRGPRVWGAPPGAS